MHTDFTKVFFNNYVVEKEIKVDNKGIDIVQQRIYLGKVARI